MDSLETPLTVSINRLTFADKELVTEAAQLESQLQETNKQAKEAQHNMHVGAYFHRSSNSDS